jgi:hypothetical protein
MKIQNLCTVRMRATLMQALLKQFSLQYQYMKGGILEELMLLQSAE